MKTRWIASPRLATFAAAAVLVVAAGCASMKAEETGQLIRLDGTKEVPPTATSAYGNADVNIGTNRSVVVTLSVSDMVPTAAHIHEGAAGANGPVIVPLVKVSNTSFIAADGAKMTESQYAAYKAGNTYINVHSAKFTGGEVRSQLAGK